MKTGEKIRNLRIKVGLSRKELGDAAGVFWRTIHNYETGKTQPPIDKLEKIAAKLEMPAAYFLNDNN